jgi:hypothetical protein
MKVAQEIFNSIATLCSQGKPLAEALAITQECYASKSQLGSSDQGVSQKSPTQDSSEVATSLSIDANPKLFRFQCSCGLTHQLKHTQSQEGICLSLILPASQTSPAKQSLDPSVDPEELRNALFGDSASEKPNTFTTSSQA